MVEEISKLDCKRNIKDYKELYNHASISNTKFAIDSAMLNVLRKLVFDGCTEEAIYILKKIGLPDE